MTLALTEVWRAASLYFGGANRGLSAQSLECRAARGLVARRTKLKHGKIRQQALDEAQLRSHRCAKARDIDRGARRHEPDDDA
jgi:hypothetical protein